MILRWYFLLHYFLHMFWDRSSKLGNNGKCCNIYTFTIILWQKLCYSCNLVKPRRCVTTYLFIKMQKWSEVIENWKESMNMFIYVDLLILKIISNLTHTHVCVCVCIIRAKELIQAKIVFDVFPIKQKFF